MKITSKFEEKLEKTSAIRRTSLKTSLTISKIFAQILVFLPIALLGLTAFAPDVYAQNFSVFTIPKYCNQPKMECGWNELIALGSEVLQFAIYLAVLGATVAFVYAGGKMVMNNGNSSEVEAAKKIMGKAALGLVITMCAWLIVDFILDNLGVGAEFRSLVR